MTQCGKTRLIVPVGGSGAPYTLRCGKRRGHDDYNLPLDGRYHFDTVKQKGWHPPVERILEEGEGPKTALG